jgi:hypothetical protein
MTEVPSRSARVRRDQIPTITRGKTEKRPPRKTRENMRAGTRVWATMKLAEAGEVKVKSFCHFDRLKMKEEETFKRRNAKIYLKSSMGSAWRRR